MHLAEFIMSFAAKS